MLRSLQRNLTRIHPPEVRLRNEFNRWAQRGLSDTMESEHMWFAEEALCRMNISSADSVLDLGCGGGFASRLIAARSGELCHVIGIDVSDEMVRYAGRKSSHLRNVGYVCGSAAHIPCRDHTFTKVLSISAFYYFPDQKQVLEELFRVVTPGAELFILVALYKGIPQWFASASELKVPVEVHSAEEYRSMLNAAGWEDVDAQEIVRDCRPGNMTAGHDRALRITARRPFSKADNPFAAESGNITV